MKGMKIPMVSLVLAVVQYHGVFLKSGGFHSFVPHIPVVLLCKLDISAPSPSAQNGHRD